MHSGVETSDAPRGLTDPALPSISVVVAFRKSETCVLECLRSIYEMQYPAGRLEVIAVDDGQDHALAQVIRRRFPGVMLLRNEASLGADASKQKGIDAATGDIIAHTDADCTVHPLWARVIAKNLSAGVDAVTGPVWHPRTLLRELIAVSDFRDSQHRRSGWVKNFPGCNFAVCRGLRDFRYNRSDKMRGGSDRLFSWRLSTIGCRIWYDPAMEVCHAPAVDAASLLRRRLSYGRTALGLRKIDSTLPGAALARMGPLAAPAYLCYKLAKDVYRLLDMARTGVVNPWHVPALLPALVLFRLVDAVGMLTGHSVVKRPRGTKQVRVAEH